MKAVRIHTYGDNEVLSYEDAPRLSPVPQMCVRVHAERVSAVAGALTALVIVMPATAVAQAPDTPRTAWGAPDLGGIWDYSSLTPMARPPQFKDQAVLTEEESAAFLGQQVAFWENLDDDKTVPGNEVPSSVFQDAGTTVVADRRSSLIIDPPTGRRPPMVEGGATRAAAIRSSYGRQPFDSHHDFGLMDRCLGTIGFPIVPGPYNNNVQIFQTPDHVAILAESMHFARIIPLDGRPQSGLSQFGGDGRGHWDGDTLVVESSNFDGELTMIGTEPQRLIERFTRQGDTIQYELTVDDPEMWATTWTARVPIQKTVGPLFEYACHEGNYGLENMLHIARARDRAPIAESR